MALTGRVFDVDQVVDAKIAAGDDPCLFDAAVVETALQELIAKETDNRNAQLSDTMNTSDRTPCPTFVVATTAVHAEGHPTLFRSYNCKGRNANKCAIWQAARCTCAEPRFFKPMEIKVPAPGGTYTGGGYLYNNPSELALEEAKRIWPEVNLFCLVSIGAGRQKSAEFVDFKDLERPNRKSFFTSKLRKPTSGIKALKRMGEACITLLGNAEPIHQRVLQSANVIGQSFPYFRVNVGRGMDTIGFQEWKALSRMGQLTNNYMAEGEQQSLLNSCVKALRRASAVGRIGVSI
jgi:predicted acylesterase/phospholipase RssA